MCYAELQPAEIVGKVKGYAGILKAKSIIGGYLVMKNCSCVSVNKVRRERRV